MRGFYRGWSIVAASGLGLAMGVGSVGFFTFSLFIAPLHEEFGWSRGELSVAPSVIGLCSVIGAMLAGRIVDRIGPRRLILVSYAVYGAAFASLYLLSAHLWHLYLGYAVVTLAALGTTPIAFVRLVLNWFNRRRGFAIGLTTMGTGVGTALLPLLVHRSIEHLGWRATYAVVGVAIWAIMLPLAYFVVRDRPTPAEGLAEGVGDSAGPSPAAPDGARRTALQTRAFWQLVVIFFSASLCVFACASHLSPMLTDRGFTTNQAAVAISLVGVSTIIGRVGVGWLMDRVFVPRLTAVVFAICAAGMLTLRLGSGSVALVCGAVSIGMAIGCEMDLMPYLVSRYFGLGLASELFAYLFAVFTLASAAGPYLMGFGFDRLSSYQPMLLIFSFVMMGASVGAFFLPSYSLAQSVSREGAPKGT